MTRLPLSTALIIALVSHAQAADEGPPWVTLFDGADLSAWAVPKTADGKPGWAAENGELVRVAAAGHLFTKEAFGDFELRTQFKLPAGGNSGVLFRSRDNVEHQIELLADAGKPVAHGSSGAVFRRVVPKANAAKPAGEWNDMTLKVVGRRATVVYNGQEVVAAAEVEDLPFRGPLGFQEHGTGLAFRNVAVRRLDPPQRPWEKAVADAAGKPPMTPDEARAFMRTLTKYVRDHHLKTDPKSDQKGMVYEYYAPARAGQFDRWVQGEALDTMHDGAWFAVAMANAYRATGDAEYKAFLTDWQLPFYAKMLNYSDVLFRTEQLDVKRDGVKFGKEHRLQDGEKGFVPYWWDDGASVSLERRKLGDPRAEPPFACTDALAGEANPQAKLSGYSHGSSNHLAQDLGPMLLLGWLVLRDSPAEADRTLAASLAKAAKNLQECRERHGAPGIPAVVGPYAVTNGDAAARAKVAVPDKPAPPTNHYTRLLMDRAYADTWETTPAFADDSEYLYYAALSKSGAALPKTVLHKLVFDAFTQPMAFRYWSDTAAVPPGLNRFDLAGQRGKSGKFESYRSDKFVGFGSRMGPQNMVVSGWALQALAAHPGLWNDAVKQLFPDDLVVPFLPDGATYRVEGKPEPGASEEFTLGGAKLRLASHRNALVVCGTFEGESVKVWVHAGAGVNRMGEGVTVKRGEPINTGRGVAGLVLDKPGSPTTFEFAVPYSVMKGRDPWANGVELARYTLAVGDAERTFVLASGEADVEAALERELAGGLRTWEAIFAAKGFVPTGLNVGGDWDGFSDAGGYAHLIGAAAQYLLWKDGKRDWEAHGVPAAK